MAPKRELLPIHFYSPLFTDAVQQRITDTLTGFREYLVRLTLEIPTVAPLVGIADPHVFLGSVELTDAGGVGSEACSLMMMSGSRYEAKIYSSRKPSTDRDHTILLVPSAIDNKAEVAALYSLYAIGLNIDRITPDDDMFYSSVRSSAMAVGADYFAGSFSDSPYYGVVFPFAIPTTLWEFRQKLGREFTDRLMAYTMRAFNESIYRKTKEDQVAYLCQT